MTPLFCVSLGFCQTLGQTVLRYVRQDLFKSISTALILTGR